MYSDKKTEELLAELESKIHKVYSKAAKELEEEYKTYISGYDEVVDDKVIHHKGLKERIEKERIAYKNGAYTKQEWMAYQVAQIGRGERWEALRDTMANGMVKSNEIASALINGTTPSVYALNYNYAAYEVEKATGAVFNIYNEEAVKRLFMGENSTEFKVTKVNPKRDYLWNKQRIDSALLSGIIQGKPIDKIANDFLAVMGSNRASAIRNARTSVTSAQNAGRYRNMVDVQDAGIEVLKEWVATNDNRTRDSHRYLDGVRVPIDDTFPNGLEFPADPAGEPAEVYNCRCAMRSVFPKYASGKDYRTTNTRLSYEDWLESKRNKQ